MKTKKRVRELEKKLEELEEQLAELFVVTYGPQSVEIPIKTADLN